MATTVSAKTKRRLKVALFLKGIAVVLYVLLSSMYSDGEHSKEIERLEQMMRENTSEEREWKDKERYVLAEEAARVRAEAEAEGVDVPAALLMSGSSTTSTSSTPARRPSRKVASLEYYD